MTIRLVPVLGAALAAVFSSIAVAGSGGGWKAFRDPTVQEFGHQWSKVGDPGNAAHVIPAQFPWEQDQHIGRTSYKYRIMTREVTIGEWFEFVQAYAPYVAFGTAQSPGLIGNHIQYHGYANGLPQYSLSPAFADLPMTANWRHTARFANWLHNDQADAAWAFESGVYDTSTFGTTQNEMGINILTDQQARSEGARFFIPTFDEWTKAGHWDPNRYGEGEGGYWLYPTTSDTAPVSGHPDFGGETNGGPFPSGQTRPEDVGSYPDAQSPWGLLDLSGGATEWMEDIESPDHPAGRFVAGSSVYAPSLNPAYFDYLGRATGTGPTSRYGVRLASIIPSPGTGSGLVAVSAFLLNRRRRPCAPSWRSFSLS